MMIGRIKQKPLVSETDYELEEQSEEESEEE
jgi:hypothetical protein